MTAPHTTTAGGESQQPTGGNRMQRTVAALLTVAALTGCSQISTQNDLRQQAAALDRRAADLDDREAQLEAIADECTIHGKPIDATPADQP